MKSICVFCGAYVGHDPVYREAAHELGGRLAARQIELVWGGGRVGLMGVVADAVLAAGGETYGVMPAFMAERELAHKQSNVMNIVESMHERKANMSARAQAFIALPGGLGTLDELFEVVTWAQLHLHDKPIGLLNVNGFFNPLLKYLQHCCHEGFIQRKHVDLIKVSADPDVLLDALDAYMAPHGDWLETAHV